MKRSLLYIPFATAILFLASCKKLDQLPKSSATANTIFNNKEGLELYTNSFYEMLPSGSGIHSSDNMSDYFARTQVPEYLQPGAFGPRQSSGWDWGHLRNVNYFIENLKTSTLDTSLTNPYLGLARFFRAYFYFDKLKRFGAVPWINKPIPLNDSALFAARDPRTLIADSIIADLEYATHAITRTTDNSSSLITKNVAYGLLSRVTLFEGTFRNIIQI